MPPVCSIAADTSAPSQLMIMMVGSSATAAVTNVIVPGSGYVFDYAPSLVTGGEGVVVSYSDWADSTAVCADPNYSCGAGVIDADPLLVKAAKPLPAGALGPDFTWAPQASSPVVNAGDSAAAAGMTADYVGNPRVRRAASN